MRTMPSTALEWHSRVWGLTWPVVLSNLSLPLVGAVDTAVMGRFPDPAYIGAVALGAMLFHTAFWIFSFLKQGTTGEVAQAHGAEDAAAVGDAMVRGVAAALLLGFGLVAVSVPVAAIGFWLMQGSAVVESLAEGYFSVRMLGAPATLLNMVVMGVLIGSQRARSALGLQLLLNLSNIGLNIWFVVGLGLGVQAVAAASVIADVLAAGVGLYVLLRMARASGATFAPARAFEPARLKRLLVVNADIAVLLHFMTFMAYGLDGFAHTAEALAGGAYGRGRRDEFRLAVRYTTAWAAGLATVASLIFAMAGESIVALLTTQLVVREAAAAYLPWLVVSPLVSVWCFQLDGIFIGTLRTSAMRNAMIVSVAAYAVFVQYSVAAFGNHGLWAALLLLNIMRAMTLGWYLPSIERVLSTRA